MRIRVLFILLLGVFLTSCDNIFSTRKNEPLAKVGSQTLYMSDVENMFPKNARSGRDTNNLLKGHIESWVKQQLLLQLAEDNLSTEMQNDISKQVEDYRTSLLVYRYEQMYVEQRLDTIISEKEYEDFYNVHKQTMVLSNPIVKVLFIKLKKNSPYLDKIKKLYTSTKPEDMTTVQNLCMQVAIKYDYFNEKWIEFDVLTKELPSTKKSYEEMVKTKKRIEVEDQGDIYLVAVRDYKSRGTIAPLEYEEENIKSLILNKRKQEMMIDLEERVLLDAAKENRVIFYTHE